MSSIVPRSSTVGNRRVAWPVLLWPAPDQAAWGRARTAGDFLSDDGAAADWRDATIRSAIGEYGRFLAFLHDRGLLDPEQGPAERATPATLRVYVTFLQQGRSSTTVASYVGVLGMVIQAMVPEQNWTWLWTMHAKLLRRSRPTRDKRSKLVPSRELLRLGMDLMDAAGSAIDT
ncbi:MAG: hypothetical protein J0H91_00150, partial [Rhodospirillales bacterium]|nr:hypothetical protein [Rhodospirillales bacterium]